MKPHRIPLPGDKPAPKFRSEDKVTIHGRRFGVFAHYGHRLVDSVWVPTYVLCPLTKHNEFDMRYMKSKKSMFRNIFLESVMVKA